MMRAETVTTVELPSLMPSSTSLGIMSGWATLSSDTKTSVIR